ncbi:MAG: hypothetical protein JW938_06335 [Candidatus Omnitrophica bacterium]|nr:hypothetical protein [Candidatus Omnitrophota bacterium]
METRAIKQAITWLMLLFFIAQTSSLYAQQTVAMPQSVPQLVIAETAVEKGVPVESTVTTSDLPIYIPDFISEEIEVPLGKRAKIKRFFSLQWLSFLKWFWTKPKIDEKSESAELLREWEEMLGVDIFYVYFKAQEARKYVKEKCSFKVLGMRASADYRDGKIFLIMKRKF